MRYLLDTSALLAHYRQEDGWQEVQALFETDEADLIAASVSLTEFGRRLRELGANETEAEEVLSAYQLLFTEIASVDVAVARAAFVLGSRTPRRLPLVDALIAAVAPVGAPGIGGVGGVGRAEDWRGVGPVKRGVGQGDVGHGTTVVGRAMGHLCVSQVCSVKIRG